MKFINIGFGNVVSSERLIAVTAPDSAPVKRIIGDAKEKGHLIDCTQGRKTKSVLITDSSHIILSYLTTESLMQKLEELN